VSRPWLFHRTGGTLCLDLANTVSWRRSERPIERLPEYGDLVEWARQSGVLTPSAARALRREARRQPVAAARVLARARALREVIYRVFAGLADGRPPSSADLGYLDREFHDAWAHVRLGQTSSGFRLTWAVDDGPALALPLWAAARSVAEALTAAAPDRIKTCPASNCGWVFIDTTRSGTRRWCAMEACGSRAKAREYYARRRRGRRARRSLDQAQAVPVSRRRPTGRTKTPVSDR